MDFYESRFEATADLPQRIAQVESKELKVEAVDSNPHLRRIVLQSYPSSDPLPDLWTGEDLDSDWKRELSVKERIAQASPPLTGLQSSLLRSMHSYNDMLVTVQDHRNAGDIKTAYAIHALNHIYKARDKMTKNSLKIKTALAEKQETPYVRASDLSE
jgi:U3 small nucleolar RNA-associated protein 25